MHITASVYINDDQSGLLADYEEWLEDLVPHEPINRYRHNETGKDNADAHLKRQIMGREVVVAVTDGKLDYGRLELDRGVYWVAVSLKMIGNPGLLKE
jgi:thiamine phosphate synthase YjbQ (UPF0047 family)